ncbi:MAG: hypothetical protein AAGJ08_26380, partial [Cyanobacteria bacterium P01_H01_bin.35]
DFELTRAEKSRIKFFLLPPLNSLLLQYRVSCLLTPTLTHKTFSANPTYSAKNLRYFKLVLERFTPDY